MGWSVKSIENGHSWGGNPTNIPPIENLGDEERGKSYRNG